MKAPKSIILIFLAVPTIIIMIAIAVVLLLLCNDSSYGALSYQYENYTCQPAEFYKIDISTTTINANQIQLLESDSDRIEDRLWLYPDGVTVPHQINYSGDSETGVLKVYVSARSLLITQCYTALIFACICPETPRMTYQSSPAITT